MFGIALTVEACLQSGTRADVAWVVDSDGLQVGDWADAVVFTPGGGRTGSLLSGALDGKLAELAGIGTTGRLVEAEVGPVDALIAELDSEGRAKCLIVPADVLPEATWGKAIRREPFTLVVGIDGDEVVGAELVDAGDAGTSMSVVEGNTITSTFVATPEIVIVGANPVTDVLVEMAGLLGWRPRMVTDVSIVGGLIAPLSARDMVVVAGHDLELAGAALATALESRSGYIASLGSRKMQADRSDWLAYRGVTDLARVHGPAGLDIGADTPAEIAVSIVAEAIAESVARKRA
jgi:xanthine dehydrogenase accessory factor